MKRYFGIIYLVILVFAVGTATNAVPKMPLVSVPFVSSPAKEPVKTGWQGFKQPGGFVMALARDAAGNLWVATEGGGVWRYAPKAETGQNEKQKAEGGNFLAASPSSGLRPPSPPVREKTEWKRFTTKDGLGDDYGYDVAVDQQGRVWVGHLNHGVSVYNGYIWKNYDIPYGPIGERVFKIAVCPTDGDVWMATSAGLTGYSVSKDTWTHYTKGQGLPSDQISTIAFDDWGNLYLGTQCDGVAIASRSSDYEDWRRAPLGAPSGLPSRLINEVLVADGSRSPAYRYGFGWIWSL